MGEKIFLVENDSLDLCFNNCNPATNGEKFLISSLRESQTVFDVGCRSDSELLNYKGTVHYFDPVPQFIEELKKKDSFNYKSHYNKFGLSSSEMQLEYYPRYQSFYNRVNSCQIDDSTNKILLSVKKAKDYISNLNISKIHFLKIDVEGHELDVITGFEDNIRNVELIQFEYGGTALDSQISLSKIINYLSNFGFIRFGYLNRYGYCPLSNLEDHYQYCNIVCHNSLFMRS